MASDKMGRPTKYSEKLVDEICEKVSTSKQSIVQLCKENEHWPAITNLYVWLNKYPYFRDKYNEAKKNQVNVNADMLQEILSEDHYYYDQHGNKRVDAAVLAIKTKIGTWLMSKLAPKDWGDKIQNETTVTIKHEDALKSLE